MGISCDTPATIPRQTVQHGVRRQTVPAAAANARARLLCRLVETGELSESSAREELAVLVHGLSIAAYVSADYAQRSALIRSATDQDDLTQALDELLERKVLSAEPGGLDFDKLAHGSLTAWVNGLAKAACFTAARNNFRRTHGKVELVGDSAIGLLETGEPLGDCGRTSTYAVDTFLDDAAFNVQLSRWETLSLNEQRRSRAQVLMNSYGFPEPSRPLNFKSSELALDYVRSDPEAAKRSAGRDATGDLALLWQNYDEEQRQQLSSVTAKVAQTLAIHALELKRLPLSRDYGVFAESLNLCDDHPDWPAVAQEVAVTFAPWRFIMPATKVADKQAFRRAHLARADRFEQAAQQAADFPTAPLGDTPNEVAHGCLQLLKGTT